MKTTKKELQECIVNAVSRLIKEGKTIRHERDWGKKREPNKKQEMPYHMWDDDMMDKVRPSKRNKEIGGMKIKR